MGEGVRTTGPGSTGFQPVGTPLPRLASLVSHRYWHTVPPLLKLTMAWVGAAHYFPLNPGGPENPNVAAQDGTGHVSYQANLWK